MGQPAPPHTLRAWLQLHVVIGLGTSITALTDDSSRAESSASEDDGRGGADGVPACCRIMLTGEAAATSFLLLTSIRSKVRWATPSDPSDHGDGDDTRTTVLEEIYPALPQAASKGAIAGPE